MKFDWKTVLLVGAEVLLVSLSVIVLRKEDRDWKEYLNSHRCSVTQTVVSPGMHGEAYVCEVK